jgi:hypothetical protein
MIKILTILLLLLSLSCSTQSQKWKFQTMISEGKCEMALENLPNTNFHQASNLVTKVLLTPVSYVLSGVGYTTDYLLLVTSGVAYVAIVCGPTMFASAAAAAEGGALRCLPIPSKTIIVKTDFGKDIYRHTKKMRCKNVDPISESLRQVASCYHSRGDTQLALKQKEAIENDSYFNQCLSSVEKHQVQEMFQ